MVGGSDKAQLGDGGNKEVRVGDLREIRESKSDRLEKVGENFLELNSKMEILQF